MKTNIGLYWLLFGFFFLEGVLYTIWNIADPTRQNLPVVDRIEWVGTVVILLSAAFTAFLGYWLRMHHKLQGGELPEDIETADISDGDSEIGHFSPWSWWPIVLAGSLAIVFLGLAVGFWVALIGLPLVLVALFGWVYEYYRGNFAR